MSRGIGLLITLPRCKRTIRFGRIYANRVGHLARGSAYCCCHDSMCSHPARCGSWCPCVHLDGTKDFGTHPRSFGPDPCGWSFWLAADIGGWNQTPGKRRSHAEGCGSFSVQDRTLCCLCSKLRGVGALAIFNWLGCSACKYCRVPRFGNPWA